MSHKSDKITSEKSNCNTNCQIPFAKLVWFLVLFSTPLNKPNSFDVVYNHFMEQSYLLVPES